MSSNNRMVDAASEARSFTAKTGGLPEITRASADLRAAIDQTRNQIFAAEFADRFPRIPSAHFLEMIGQGMSHMTREAVADEGEAGKKRAELLGRICSAERDLLSVIAQITEIRTDLIVSQDEFKPPLQTED